MQTVQQLEELAEKERSAGNRQKFLEIQKQIEIKEQEKVLAQHKLHLEAVKKEFPAGLYIPELRTSIKEIKDGCGTQQDWVNVYLSGIERPLKYWDLKKKIRKAKEEKAAGEYFNKLKFSDTKLSLCIGEYSYALDMLIKVMSLDLSTTEEVDEYNIDWYCQVMADAKQEAIKNGYTDEQAEEIALKAEDEEREKNNNNYISSVKRAINYLLEFHGLELTQLNEKYYLAAQESWEAAADKVAVTITGYGMFEFNSGKELKEGLPCKTYCEAAIQHLHWLKYYPEVYGVTGYRRIYER